MKNDCKNSKILARCRKLHSGSIFSFFKDLYACYAIFRSFRYEKRYYMAENPHFSEYLDQKYFSKYCDSKIMPLRILSQFIYHPVVHYVFHGVYDGYDLIDGFNSAYYLEKYPDVLNKKINPYCHYVQKGLFEGRAADSTFLSYDDFYMSVSALSAAQMNLVSTDELILSLINDSNSFVLVFSHGEGGGAEEYLSKVLISNLQHEYNYVGVIIPSRCKKVKGLELTILSKKASTKMFVSSFDRIRMLTPNKIIINNIAYYGKELENNIQDLLIKTSADISILFHDFYCVCPAISMTDANGMFCHMEHCHDCGQTDDANIILWRSIWQKILDKSSDLVFFSNSSKQMVEKVYELDASKVSVQPHKPLVYYDAAEHYKFSKEQGLVIGFVGSMNKIKGADIICQMALSHPDIDFVVIGAVANSYKSKIGNIKNIKVTGAYQHKELPSLLTQNNVKITVIASIWLETFCYVLQELMMLECPVVSFNIGAQGERTSTYKYGVVVDDLNADSMFAGIKKLEQKLGELYEA